MKTPLIADEQRIESATHNGRKIPVYDDGYGPLWIHFNSLGVSGIVRARTFEDAYGICEDEFFPEASETVEELRKEYGFRREHVRIVRDPSTGTERDCAPEDFTDGGKLPAGMFVRWETRETPCAEDDEHGWTENELFCEAYGFRPSGPRSGKREDGSPRDPIGHGIFAKDLNGDRLEELTPELLAQLGIELEVAEW